MFRQYQNNCLLEFVERQKFTIAWFVCACLLVDIDECITGSHECDVNVNCTNTVGSHNCTCKEGFTGNGRLCLGTLTSDLLTIPLGVDKLQFHAFGSLYIICL